MRTKREETLFVLFSLALLLVFVTQSVHAQPERKSVTCRGGSETGYRASKEWWPGPDDNSYPDDFHFIAYAPSTTENINGWVVTIAGMDWDGDDNDMLDFYFKKISCTHSQSNELTVDAWDCSGIPYGKVVEVTVTLWLDQENAVFIKEEKWTTHVSGQEWKCLPNRGWMVDGEIVTIYNVDDIDNFTISGFGYYVSECLFDPKTIVSWIPIGSDIPLAPGEDQAFVINLGGIESGYVYFHYDMLHEPGGSLLSEEWAIHGMSKEEEAVGGFWVPVDKFGLLAPYIGLASTILVAMVATAIYAKRVKRRKEKQ